MKVSHILQSSLMSDGSRRFATPPQQIAVYNKRIQPVLDEEAEPSPPWVYSDKDYLVGDEVRNLFYLFFSYGIFVDKMLYNDSVTFLDYIEYQGIGDRV